MTKKMWIWETTWDETRREKQTVPRKRVHNHGPSSSGIAIVSTHKTAGRIYTRMTAHAHAHAHTYSCTQVSPVTCMAPIHTYRLLIYQCGLCSLHRGTKIMPVSFAIAEGSLGNSKNRLAVSRYLRFITFM